MRRITMLIVAGLLTIAASTLAANRASAQPQVVTDDNLEQSIANAKTAADHEAIAVYYDKEAAENEAKAKFHHSVHKSYDRFKAMKPVDMGHHCDELAKSFQRTADQDKALAADHREMAKTAGAKAGQ
jgi:hypothetical protein